MHDAMTNNAGVSKINPSMELKIGHIIEFVDLWVCLEHFKLLSDTKDDILWKFEANEEYSGTYTYKGYFAPC